MCLIPGLFLLIKETAGLYAKRSLLALGKNNQSSAELQYLPARRSLTDEAFAAVRFEVNKVFVVF
jgi:hypothetical protein